VEKGTISINEGPDTHAAPLEPHLSLTTWGAIVAKSQADKEPFEGKCKGEKKEILCAYLKVKREQRTENFRVSVGGGKRPPIKKRISRSASLKWVDQTLCAKQLGEGDQIIIIIGTKAGGTPPFDAEFGKMKKKRTGGQKKKGGGTFAFKKQVK